MHWLDRRGGKTTTASIMARLYDPTKGNVYLDGKDIRFMIQLNVQKKLDLSFKSHFYSLVQ